MDDDLRKRYWYHPTHNKTEAPSYHSLRTFSIDTSPLLSVGHVTAFYKDNSKFIFTSHVRISYLVLGATGVATREGGRGVAGFSSIP